jgi:hypothetical protein
VKGDGNSWNPEANKATKLASVLTYMTGKSSSRSFPEVKKNFRAKWRFLLLNCSLKKSVKTFDMQFRAKNRRFPG